MVYMTFTCLQGHKPGVTALDPQLQGLGEDSQFQGPLHELYVLDDDADDLTKKVELYIKKTAPFFYERELSEFMKPTLIQAAELSQINKEKVCCIFSVSLFNKFGPNSYLRMTICWNVSLSYG